MLRYQDDYSHVTAAGIGTYDIHEKTVHKSWYGEMCSSISQTIDQGVGTTFDAHVMAGYRFLMRYYDSVSHTTNRTGTLPKAGSPCKGNRPS